MFYSSCVTNKQERKSTCIVNILLLSPYIKLIYDHHNFYDFILNPHGKIMAKVEYTLEVIDIKVFSFK